MSDIFFGGDELVLESDGSKGNEHEAGLSSYSIHLSHQATDRADGLPILKHDSIMPGFRIINSTQLSPTERFDTRVRLLRWFVALPCQDSNSRRQTGLHIVRGHNDWSQQSHISEWHCGWKIGFERCSRRKWAALWLARGEANQVVPSRESAFERNASREVI